MIKRWIVIIVFQVAGLTAFSQKNNGDSLLKASLDSIGMEADFNYEDLFNDLASFLDSISKPHSYFLASANVAPGNFNFTNKSNVLLTTINKITYSPTLGYYHKNGLGITATGYLVNDEKKLNLYQYSVSPSYDYLDNRNLATGASYTRYFTSDSLSFYTSPLQNELYAYFTYRSWWVRPSIAVSYGWGSRSDYKEREEQITSLRLRRLGYTRVSTKESVSDFSVMTSVRHDFYWLDVLSAKDHIRLTPQISFASGTQKFGFNRSTNSYGTQRFSGNNVKYNSENIYLDDKLNFQPLSLSLYLRSEYAIGKLFLQPQILFDYYFPESQNPFNTLFSFSAGVMF
jgi:hypothetical protein